MCTVTFVPIRDSFLITSNRDEKTSRKLATPPAIYEHNNARIVCPRDGEAGGTWIALNENGNAGVLLNGAFENHIHQPPYRLSRGKIFFDLIAKDQPAREFDRLDLFNIESFTIVLLEHGNLFECRWDGDRKHCRQLKNYRHHIWSSATLYDKEAAQKREQWFAEFLNNHPNPTQQDILRFHQMSVAGDEGNSILMSRNGLYQTVSITSILMTRDRGSMKYFDMVKGEESEKRIEFIKELDTV